MKSAQLAVANNKPLMLGISGGFSTVCYGKVHDMFGEDIPGSKLHVRASWLVPLAQFQDLEEPLFQHLKIECEEGSPEKGYSTLSPTDFMLMIARY